MGMVLVGWVALMGAYGIWYSIYAQQFNRYTKLKKSRYERRLYERILTFTTSLTILICAFAELVRLWKSK